MRVGPKMWASLTGRIPYSGRVVVPTITNPARFSRAVTLWSYSATCSCISLHPYVSRMPVTGRLFLIAVGTPANGRSSPGAIASAAARAPSSSTSTNAFSSGLSSSMRSRDVSTSSREDTSPSRTIAASSVADRNKTSLSAILEPSFSAPRTRAAPGLGCTSASLLRGAFLRR